MIQAINHIGIVVRNIQSSQVFYIEKLGLKLSAVEVNEAYQVKIAFFPVGEVLIELIEPLNEDSAIARYLKEHGEGIHHIAFESDDLGLELKRLSTLGTPIIDEVPQPGGQGTRVAFLHPAAANGVSVELLEKTGK